MHWTLVGKQDAVVGSCLHRMRLMEEFVIDYSWNNPELIGALMASLMQFPMFFSKSESFSKILNSRRRCV